jgi:hypothetical protein
MDDILRDEFRRSGYWDAILDLGDLLQEAVGTPEFEAIEAVVVKMRARRKERFPSTS